MKKNRENRVSVMMTVTVGAGNFMLEGMVANISRNGFMVTDLPKHFNPLEKKISTIIATSHGNYKMDVRSTWAKESGHTKDVGFEILNYGSDWTELLDKLDPVTRQTDSATNWATDA